MVVDTPAALVDALRGRGVTLAAINGRIKVTPAGMLSDAERDAIREHKPALLALLAWPNTTDAVATVAIPPPDVSNKPAASRRTVPVCRDPVPTTPCPSCGGRAWRLRDTPGSAGYWLWVCAACADAATA